jgi:hypothetical protein
MKAAAKKNQNKQSQDNRLKEDQPEIEPVSEARMSFSR